MTREKWEFPPPSPRSAILRRHIRMIRKKKGKNTHQDAKTRLGQSRRRGVPSDFLVLIRVRYIDSVSPSPVGAIVKLLYFIICAYFAVNLCVLSALSLAPPRHDPYQNPSGISRRGRCDRLWRRHGYSAGPTVEFYHPVSRAHGLFRRGAVAFCHALASVPGMCTPARSLVVVPRSVKRRETSHAR